MVLILEEAGRVKVHNAEIRRLKRMVCLQRPGESSSAIPRSSFIRIIV